MLSAIFLKGFKTFARPVRMPLSGGITAIVGPNGSGKSNITDAVLFALGEGSPSVLRAGSMDDVVFSGSETLPAANAAEVTLVVENGDGAISLPYREVSLTRRVTRGGENEYRINGVRARLADIRAVAGEAGLGRHSILRQGSVDAIVAGGAAACRVALEEAAGLGVFRRRRQTAARKLERAAAQLESSRRLEGELAGQLRRLEAEAAAAREYRELEARYRRLSLAHLYRAATRDLDSQRALLADAENRAGDLAVKEGALREEGLRLAAEEREAEERVREAERRAEGLECCLEGLRAEALRAERAQLRLQGGRERAVDRRRVASRLREELEKTSSAVRRVEGELGGLEAEHLRRKRELGELEDAVERGRAALSAATARRARAAAGLEDARARRARAERRLGEEAALGEGELGRLAASAEALSSFSPELVRGRSAALLDKVEELSGVAQRSGAGLGHRGGALAALVGQAEATVRSLRDSGAEGPGRRLYEVVRARPGYEVAVEAALGHLAGGVLAENIGEGIKYLTGESPAERVVVRLDAEGVPESASPPGKPLFECVEVLDDSYGEAVARLLGGIYVLEETHPGAAPRNGHVAVTRDGIRLTRTSASRRTAEGDFVRAARLAEGEARLHELKNRLGEDLYDLRETLRALSGRLEGLATGGQLLDAHAARAARVTRLLARETERRATRAARAREQRARAEDELRGLEAEVRLAGEGLRATEGTEEESNAALARAAEAVEPAYAASREAAGRLARARAVLEEGRGREREILRRLERLEGADATGGVSRLADLARRAAEVGRHLDVGARDRLAAARRARSEAAGLRGAVAERRAAVAGEAAEFAVGLARAGTEAELLRGELARAREAATEAEAEIFEEWGATLEAARAEAEGLPGAADAERERARLARKLKGFGDVNLLAISQEGALRERHDFVAAQRADAEAAAGELEGMIGSIDAEISARFEATFRDVRREFAAIVPRMMDGAAGELDLSEEGVEIGLRLKRRGWRPLRVLSGGERALLALSFLFGIFLGRREDGPGAFCVLDEAEAALDDINLARFLAVVDSYRADGQFLLVTHQKRTMAAADVLYGVTPDATGATIVVSKRLTGD